MHLSIRRILAGMTFGLTAVAALPTNLYFDNNTDVTFGAYTAGQPGATIAANVNNFSVPYIAVMFKCNNAGVPLACPIEFYDKSNGKKIASVILNIKTATISAPPVFESDYASFFSITGWDGSPLSRISIKNVS